MEIVKHGKIYMTGTGQNITETVNAIITSERQRIKEIIEEMRLKYKNMCNDCEGYTKSATEDIADELIEKIEND